MDLQKLFDEYSRHGLYLNGWSAKTVTVYQRAFTSFQQSFGQPDSTGGALNKTQLEAWVVPMRESGLMR